MITGDSRIVEIRAGRTSSKGMIPARLQDANAHTIWSARPLFSITRDFRSSDSLPPLVNLDEALPPAHVARVERGDFLELLEPLDLVRVVNHDQELGAKGSDAILEGGEVGKEGQREGEGVEDLVTARARGRKKRARTMSVFSALDGKVGEDVEQLTSVAVPSSKRGSMCQSSAMVETIVVDEVPEEETSCIRVPS